MAVTLNITQSAGVAGGGVGTVTPITITPASNIVARLSVSYRDNALGVDPGATISGITLTDFTGTPTFVQVVSSGGRTVETWQCKGGAPAAAATATFTWTAPGLAPDVIAVMGVQVFNDVRQSSPTGAFNTAAATSLAPSVTVNGTAAGSMVANTIVWDSIVATTGAVGGGAVQDWNSSIGSAAQGRIRGAGSHITSPGGAVVMSWTLSLSKAWASAAEEWVEQPATLLQDPLRCPGLVPAPR